MLHFFISCSFLCVISYFVLWIVKRQKPVEEKHLLDNCTPQTKYDVFVSFRGEDIRDGFLSHLIMDFERKKINAFVDVKLERGDEVWSSLVGAIKGSSISLIIFSQDYASSHWCLEELVTILECRDKYGQILIPVFYKVEPTDVRYQSSKSYQNAFAKHQRRYETNKVQIWRDSLKKSTQISGIASSKYPVDAELVKEIVKVVLEKLAKPSVNLKRLVGIDEKIATVESLIGKEPEDTRLIGIWGMGGMGKTTLVEEVFNKLKFKYDASCFLANERDQSNKHGIIPLKKSIFSKLLGYEVDIDTPNSLPEDIVRRIGGMKVLIVLDDVNDLEHVEKLLGSLDNFESGSRVIVTTRNRQVLKANKFDEEYQLRKFSFDEALQLFNLNVFKNSDHQREYNELSERVVNYSQGVPLVVKVLAARLRGNEKEVWESELDRLKKMPLREVYDVLKWSYDDLDRKEQQVFLDLACFFLRLRKSVNVGSIKSLLKDGERDNSVAVDLKRLEDRALITISNEHSLHEMVLEIVQCKSSEDNVVFMHDSVQEMAWEIVRRESSRPASRSRLWDPDDVYEALKDNKGNESIRSIRIQLSTIKKQKLSPQIFAKMSMLQFLEISGNCNDDLFHQHYILAEGLQLLATELKFLYWDHYPLKSLPENFSTEKLVILSLQQGSVEKLWDGVKNLVNLRELDLNSSLKLKEVPDLWKATNLEVVDLMCCSMVKALPSFEHQSKLRILDLSYCNKLEAIPELPLLLKTLDVHSCKSLQTLPEFPMSLETLDVRGCHSLQTLPELPLSLEILDTEFCTSLLSLPKLPRSLKTLKATKCESLQVLPKLPLTLETLEATKCGSLQTLPELPQFLTTLDVNGCKSLQTLPKLPMTLKNLDVRHCEHLQTLPNLPLSLESLDFKGCESLRALPKLPQFLNTLDVSGCMSLQTLPEFPLFLETLDARGCESLQTLPELPMCLKSLDVSGCVSLQTLPELPLSLETLDVRGCESLQILPKLPLSLGTLDVKGFEPLQTLPELPLSLETLEVRGCEFVQEVVDLPLSVETLDTKLCISLKNAKTLPSSLKTLQVTDCESLQTLPELPHSLITLNTQYCSSLQTLPELPQYLKTLNVIRCQSLLCLPDLPLCLETLEVTECESLQNFPELPQFLKTLDVNGCKSLQTLPDLPLRLETLDVRGCESLQTIPKLPLSLETLDVRGCESLQKLQNLPLSLETLDVTGCESLQIIIEFPQSLKTLQATNCESLQTLPKFPHSLKTLDLNGCKSLQTLPELPLSLETLDVRCCDSLLTLPELPLSLQNLDIRGCESLETLPELPMSLKSLDFRACESLEALPELPLSLENLDVRGCETLQSLPKLPFSLKILQATECESLQTLPELPPFLKILDVNGCKSLQFLPHLPLSIETLDIRGCESLEALPELPLSLETLDTELCTSLQTFAKFPPSLKTLEATVCESLQTLPELPWTLQTLNVQYCSSLQNLPKLPLSLKTLNVSCCQSMESLPELPPSLETLDVSGCISIQTLPKLPVSLKALNAKDCESLKTVLFPSTTVEQLKENRKWLLFWNCLNLDEHSLLAMGLNSRINVTKFANHHLSSPNHDDVENYNDYDDKYGSYQAGYIYPGSSMVEWLENKTTKDYLIIDLSSPAFSPRLGFIFCFILDKCQDTEMFGKLEVNLIISDGDGEGQKDTVGMYIDIAWTIESDHVCVIYDQRCSDMLNRRANIQTRFKIQVSKGIQTSDTGTGILSKLAFKGFGVSPISTSAYKSFIQQMELHDSIFQFHQKN
ncbi:hypothetical protein PHAVU_009G237600 [Phaseolus vulgaris]|uniref:TIR domain-containing protein n=1 Tax=Phaseolus vulgaris TaxID=3885 RepID=V7AYR3_PHAVU|nr:hypothetical protein PHAVU_009G237600g [Phaseolus vulgaris]ESW10782.1 hypothetical protein PHAVU_009G237600g [Phaseolus vulgaris]